MLAIVYNAVINMGVQRSHQTPVFISFGYMPRIGIAGSYGRSSFNFLKNVHMFSTVAGPIYIPTVAGPIYIPTNGGTRLPFSPYPRRHLWSLIFVVIICAPFQVTDGTMSLCAGLSIGASSQGCPCRRDGRRALERWRFRAKTWWC